MNMHTTIVKPITPAMLKNVAAMMTLIETIRARPQLSSGFGVFSGPSGYGKTVASTYAQNKYDCVYIEVREFWTRRAFCEAMLEELGVKPHGTIATMMREIVYTLGNDIGRPVIFDEADKLVDKGMIELARDIQEMTNAPVVLVGEEKLPHKLKAYERVDNRVLDWVLAQPCDADDARVLAKMILKDIEVDRGLLERVCRDTKGCTRRVANTLYEVANFARNNGLKALTAETYGGRIFTDRVPVRGAR